MLIRREGSLERSPAATIAAVLATLYALGLLTLAGSLVVARISGNGTIAHLNGYAEVRGWAFVVVACIGGALLLAFGAIFVWRGRRGLMVIAPLALIVLIGCIGEPIDIISGNPLGESSSSPGCIRSRLSAQLVRHVALPVSCLEPAFSVGYSVADRLLRASL